MPSFKTAMGMIEVTEGDQVGFGQWIKDGDAGWNIPGTIPVVMIAKHKWEELGSPSTITVTVEPGDVINHAG